MGAKTSKTELTRRKSFNNIGRSSQRSLFQKSKLKLDRISKQIDKVNVSANATTLDCIKNDLDAIENELNGITDSVKAKNQEKFDDICGYLHATQKKYSDKFNVPVTPQTPPPITNEIVLRHNTDTTEEPKKLSVSFREENEETKKPSIKFGVQVLPPSPQISQVVLKRKTYPVNTPLKNEVINRNTTDGVVQHQNGTSKITIETTNSTSKVTQNSEFNSILIEGSSKRKYMKSNSILGIEAINNEINELEGKLKYFTGSKDSQNYLELHDGLVHNLKLLDSIDTDEDPITKQEKRILRQRINELLKILECLVEQISDSEDQFMQQNKMNDRPQLYTSVTAI